MKLEDDAGNKMDFSDNHGDLSLFAGFAFDVSPNMIVTLSPTVTFGVIGDGNDATTYSLGAALNIK
jgi:hypothetical protein